MNIFSAVSIMAFMIYLFIGIYAFNIERKSKINRLFLAFCLSMSIWSFAYAFVYVNIQKQYIWMNISAIGWCTFSSFILHLVLLFTENKAIKNTLTKILIYIPSALFFYISVFLIRQDNIPSKFIVSFFNYGDFIYHFSFLSLSIILVTLWGIRSQNKRKKRQAKIIVVSSLMPFLLNLLTQTILPSLGITVFPLMGHIYSLFLILGVYYAMIKFRFFTIAPKLLVEELLQEMMDLVILVSVEGKIIRINNYTEELLKYPSKELLDEHLSIIIEDDIVAEICKLRYTSEIRRLSEVYCIKKDGTRIPVSLSCSPIIDPNMKDIIGFVIVGQNICLVKQLEKEIVERKEAEDQILYMVYHDCLTGLPNRKYFYEALNKAIENEAEEGFAVFFLDLDDLKNINDGFGHEMGDMILCEVGKRTKTCLAKTDIVARIGGDEFTFLIFGISSHEEAQTAADSILNSINKPVKINGEYFDMNASIGFSVFPYDGVDADLLVKIADSQMYMVKREKK